MTMLDIAPTVNRREGLERFGRLLREAQKRKERKRQAGVGGLLNFVRHFWDVLEPQTELVEGWALEAICKHLEAVSFGQITRLLINVPPGFMKSLLTDVFWPAWEWGALGKPHLRYVAFSYSSGLTERDNGKFRDLLLSAKFQALWGHRFKLRKIGEVKVTNDKTGSKLATSVGGIGTGERGDRVIVDDPHNIKDGESEVIRTETVRWFRESLSNRLNDMEKSAIVVIMQRVHEADVSGTIISEDLGYVHLMIPMEFDSGRQCDTGIWVDPREHEGDLAWPERFSPDAVASLNHELGPYAFAAQYQQAPTPRGGGIFKREWWQLWEGEGGKFPPFDYIVASLDAAFTEKEENDPSGFTVWGVWTDPESELEWNERSGQFWKRGARGLNKVMLVHAWRKHLQMHGSVPPKEQDETDAAYIRRTQPTWGLVQWVAHTCRRFKVDRLLIEAKASGITAAQEMQRLYGTEQWQTQLEQVTGDKVARAHAVVPAWSQRLVWAPDREWADLVIDEMETFPKGKHDDLCLAAGTLIATKRGSIPIQDVCEGDMVVTPMGWKLVTAAGQTGWSQTISRKGLRGTISHPVFTFDQGYVSLDSITQVSDICELSLCGLTRVIHQNRLSSMASPSGAWAGSENTIYRHPTPIAVEGERRGSTSRFGNTISGVLSRRVLKFITKTTIPLIAALTIWSAYRAVCIGQCLKRTALSARSEFLMRFGHWLRRGIHPPLAASGIGSMSLKASTSLGTNLTPTQLLGSSLAFGVGGTSCHGLPAGSSAAQNAKAKNPDFGEENTSSSTHIIPVFNLTVADANCYFANGILVHNCDSTTQAFKHLRALGLIQQAHERQHEETERMRYRKPQAPLYPV
jgi:predicted phage terminase large subunit-like protein